MDYKTAVKTWEDLKVGDSTNYAKTITSADIVMWCGLTGDMNPIHLDREYSKKTQFKDIIVPGIYVLGFVSATLGKILGSIYASQSVRFTQPVYVNDTVSAESTIIEKLEKKRMLKLHTRCLNQKDEVVLDGEALLYIPQPEK
ncbi:MaoC family dehydratase [Candidatus Desulfosporosinus nitrosoreducens]|uniref:MaoC family dehydratase n=1 Tax=Candidatus Desulfosporosinus nitrosoreducens TaxID=3401928 RepID=UPI00280AF4C1|nr:MaoC family dehydratase [Desulfosporosinus sp. PR]